MRAGCEAVVAKLETLEDWSHEQIEAVLRGLIEELEWKPRELFQPVRVGVTGSKISPPLFESMELIGKNESLARLTQAAAL